MLHVKVEEVHHISLLSRNSAIIDYYDLKENKIEDIPILKQNQTYSIIRA